MTFGEKLTRINQEIKIKEYDIAEKELLQIINEEKLKVPEDAQNTYYSFNNFIEFAIYFYKYRPQKKQINPENNIAEVYYLLGFINFEKKNYGKAVEYLDKALEWNPVSARIMLEKADAYRNMGELERYRIEVEKSYQYIYDSSFMAKYLRELGWYYSEKKVFDLANALYTHSSAFLNTELVANELTYIAQQEHREPRYSTNEEVEKWFKEYNIPSNIDKNIVQMIYNELQEFKKKNDPRDKDLIIYLSRSLYDITLDKSFMPLVDMVDEKTSITVKIPETYRILDKEAYSKHGVSENTLFFFVTPENRNVSIVCDGKCSEEQLERAYKLNIEGTKRAGATIESESSIEGQQHIYQAIILVKDNDKTVRIHQNYLVVNGYLLCVAWEVPVNIDINKIHNFENAGFEMDVVFSLKSIKEPNIPQNAVNDVVMNEINARLNELLAQGVKPSDAMEIVFGDNSIFRSAKEEFKTNGITKKLATLLDDLSTKIIKSDSPDPFWDDMAKKTFSLLVLSNFIDNLECSLPDIANQTNNVEFVRDLISKNLNKMNVPEVQHLINIDSTLNSDKPFKSIVEIINNAIKPYKRTELQEQGRKEQQNKNEQQTQSEKRPSTKKEVVMNEFSQVIDGLPTFKFLFPEKMGEYSQTTNNVFELKKDNVQKIRVMISKCSSYENFVKDARAWIEKNKEDTKMVEVDYRQEKIGEYPIEVFELKRPTGNVSKIYKIGYVNNCRITISGSNLGDREQIINKAFETIKWDKDFEIKKEPTKQLIIKCPACSEEFKLNWLVPASEETFYCKCPNCNAEIKSKNPNYKAI